MSQEPRGAHEARWDTVVEADVSGKRGMKGARKSVLLGRAGASSKLVSRSQRYWRGLKAAVVNRANIWMKVRKKSSREFHRHAHSPCGHVDEDDATKSSVIWCMVSDTGCCSSILQPDMYPQESRTSDWVCTMAVAVVATTVVVISMTVAVVAMAVAVVAMTVVVAAMAVAGVPMTFIAVATVAVVAVVVVGVAVAIVVDGNGSNSSDSEMLVGLVFPFIDVSSMK